MCFYRACHHLSWSSPADYTEHTYMCIRQPQCFIRPWYRINSSSLQHAIISCEPNFAQSPHSAPFEKEFWGDPNALGHSIVSGIGFWQQSWWWCPSQWSMYSALKYTHNPQSAKGFMHSTYMLRSRVENLSIQHKVHSTPIGRFQSAAALRGVVELSRQRTQLERQNLVTSPYNCQIGGLKWDQGFPTLLKDCHTCIYMCAFWPLLLTWQEQKGPTHYALLICSAFY